MATKSSNGASLADEGYLYAEIARMYPAITRWTRCATTAWVTPAARLRGPIQRVDRWYGSNVWLRGENSPHAQLTGDAGEEGVGRLGREVGPVEVVRCRVGPQVQRVSLAPSTCCVVGETWQHLEAPEPGPQAQEESPEGQEVGNSLRRRSLSAVDETPVRLSAGRGSRAWYGSDFRWSSASSSRPGAGCERKRAVQEPLREVEALVQIAEVPADVSDSRDRSTSSSAESKAHALGEVGWSSTLLYEPLREKHAGRSDCAATHERRRRVRPTAPGLM